MLLDVPEIKGVCGCVCVCVIIIIFVKFVVSSIFLALTGHIMMFANFDFCNPNLFFCYMCLWISFLCEYVCMY